jgi:circadian clock protein KaiB
MTFKDEKPVEPVFPNGDLSKPVDEKDRDVYDLTLYVTGLTYRSTEAIRSIKEICSQHLSGRCDLKIVDLLQHPEMAKADQIFAAPTLVKKSPSPTRKLIGDMSNIERIIIVLDLV